MSNILDPTALSWQRRVTEIVLIAFPLLLIAWDIVAEATTTENATISEVFIHFAYEHPVAALYLGMLFGHLTFPVAITRPHWESILIVVVCLVVGVCADRLRLLPIMMPVIPLVAGILLGHLVWPQKIATETGETLVVQTQGNATLHSRTMVTRISGRQP